MRKRRECSVISIVAVLAVGAAAAGQTVIAGNGFNSTEDDPYFTTGEVNGQGSATGGWAGAWTSSTTGVFMVVEGGCPAKGPCPGDPDQHLAMYGGASGSYHTDRMMDAWSGDFRFEFCLRLSDNADGQRDQTQIQFKNASGQRPLNIKIGASNYAMFLVNDQPMIVQNGNSLHPDMVPLGTAAENWVHLAIECDWETATFDLYWEQTDGSMKLVNTKVGWKDSGFSGDIVELEIYSPKAYGNMNVGMDVDRLRVLATPPPGPCNTAVVLTSGSENMTVVAGHNPAPIEYKLSNGGSLSHNYNIEETGTVNHSVAGLFNTGVDGSGAPLGDLVADPHYMLTANPDSAGTATYTAKDDGLPILWIRNNASSRWISVRPDDDNATGAPGQYVYRTTFTPPGVDTIVHGLLAGDDLLTDVLINGQSTGIRNSNSFSAWTVFQLNIGAADDTLDFNLINGGAVANATGLRAEFFNLAQQDFGWLTVTPVNPITVGSQASAVVSASIDTTGLPAGIYSAYLTFRNLDDCDPPNNSFEEPVVRRIEMTLTNWEVTPDSATLDVPVMANCPGRTPDPATFTVTNLGAAGNVTYTVAKLEECNWLTIDKSGPIVVGPGTADVVTATVDPTGLATGTYTCSLVFTNVGTALPKEVRTVTLHVLGTVWEYKGDVSPLDPNSAGPGLSFIIHNETPMPVSQGQVEDDPLATDGKVWRLVDSDAAKTKFRSQPNTWVSGQIGATLVARVRVHSVGPNMSQGLALGIWDDVTGDSAEVFYSGDEGSGLGTLKELRRSQSAAVAGDSAFHIIRVTVEGTVTLDRVISVYFDENPVPAISITQASNSTQGIDGFVFGAGSTGGQIDMAFDWLTATDAGAFAPGQEYDCLGRSLVLDACPMPFADADEDGDVDMNDFAALQRCISIGGGSYGAENCHCFDRAHDNDIDDFDVREFGYCATGPSVLWSPELTPFCQP